jgi:SseB protein C-terminal domain
MSTRVATVAQELHVSEIQFLGEQDGPPERMLKERLSAAFVFHRQLDRAYLALVRYADETGIALCLSCADRTNRKLAEVVGEVFGSIFAAHEHLDIVFVGEDQEPALRRVCRPFYSAPAHD